MKDTHPLRAYRKRHDLTLEDFARRARTHPSTISRVERGQRRPDFETFRRIVQATDGELTADDFMASIPEPSADEAAQ